MKNMKKIVALLVAVMLLAAMAVPAMADNTGSITLKSSPTVDVSTRTFKAYKILDATYDGDAIAYTVPAALKNWYNTYFKVGDKDVETQAAEDGVTFDYKVTQKIAALDTAVTLRPFLDAALAAAKSSGITGIDGTAVTSNKTYKFTDLAAGYYAIEDTTTGLEKDDYKSAVMLDTVKGSNVEIVVKANIPSPQKKIVTAEQLYNEKANEVGIGRTVNYVVTEYVPNYNGYDHYYYIFEDTLSKGLTFNNDIVVKIGDTPLSATATTPAKPDYYIYRTDNSDGSTYFEIAFENIKNYTIGDPIEITYSAQVNKDAVTGINPNTNKIEIEYSTNPNKSGRGDETQPGKPANKTDHPTGVGPASWTDTYTTKITVYKVDATGSNSPLPGVEFTLTGTSKSVVVKGKDKFAVNPDGDYWMLQDGTYTTTPPRTEAKLEETTGDSGWVLDDSTNDPEARTIGDHKYRPYKATDGDTTHYIINEPNTGDYKSITIKYSKTEADGTEVHTYPVKMVGTTDEDGYLTFEKLGAGSYTLDETGVLPGFNDIPNITFDLSCTVPTAAQVKAGTETATWTISNVKGGSFTQGSGDNAGTFSITVENNKGLELPETGGIGTTLFYVGGGILVLAAIILLVTKKRMSAND